MTQNTNDNSVVGINEVLVMFLLVALVFISMLNLEALAELHQVMGAAR